MSALGQLYTGARRSTGLGSMRTAAPSRWSCRPTPSPGSGSGSPRHWQRRTRPASASRWPGTRCWRHRQPRRQRRPDAHGRLGLSTQPWLTDHTIAGRVIVPGAALVEMAIRAGRDRLGPAGRTGAGGAAGAAHRCLRGPAPGRPRFADSVRSESPSTPRRGRRRHRRLDPACRRHPRTADSTTVDSGWHLAGWGRPAAVDGFYPALADTGLAYGPAFQGVRAPVAARSGDLRRVAWTRAWTSPASACTRPCWTPRCTASRSAAPNRRRCSVRLDRRGGPRHRRPCRPGADRPRRERRSGHCHSGRRVRRTHRLGRLVGPPVLPAAELERARRWCARPCSAWTGCRSPRPGPTPEPVGRDRPDAVPGIPGAVHYADLAELLAAVDGGAPVPGTVVTLPPGSGRGRSGQYGAADRSRTRRNRADPDPGLADPGTPLRITAVAGHRTRRRRRSGVEPRSSR
ncbi:hypothetical protein GXW82_02765 [Streptacidiphilus sp. 4-A2]|nr:hypothetical protein [Streptacidiphilus sp. 4-A2]